MGLKSTEDHACQARTVAGFSILSCAIGLSQIAVGVWWYLYTGNFADIVGFAFRNVFIGYVAVGGLTFCSGLLGVCVSLLRNRHGLVFYISLLLAAMICQGGVWAFIYTEQRKLSLSGDVRTRLTDNSQYHEFIQKEFNCNLPPVSSASDPEELAPQEFNTCADFISSKMWDNVWATLGLCATLICLQFLLLVMVGMLLQLVQESLRRSKVRIFHPDGEQLTGYSRRELIENRDRPSAPSASGTFISMSGRRRSVVPQSPQRNGFVQETVTSPLQNTSPLHKSQFSSPTRSVCTCTVHSNCDGVEDETDYWKAPPVKVHKTTLTL